MVTKKTVYIEDGKEFPSAAEADMYVRINALVLEAEKAHVFDMGSHNINAHEFVEWLLERYTLVDKRTRKPRAPRKAQPKHVAGA